LLDLPEDLLQPAFDDLADHGFRRGVYELRAELLHQVAGQQRPGARGQAAEPRTGPRRRGQAGRRRRPGSAASLRPAADPGAVSVPASPALARRPGKRRAAWRRRRLVLLLMSPWIVGFTVFFGYPLVMSVYLSFTHYDLLSSPRWIGTANYRYLFHDDPQVWTAVKNTLWLILIMVPLQVLFAFGVAMMDARARSGAGFFRTVFYRPA